MFCFCVLILPKLFVIISSNISSYFTLILISKLNLLLVFQVCEPILFTTDTFDLLFSLDSLQFFYLRYLIDQLGKTPY